jgi:N-acetylneuraminate synthase
VNSCISAEDRRTFENLFVLELANNHWGDLARGLQIVRDFAMVARMNSVRTAIKLQFRDVDSFVHPAFKGYTESRYIKKTEATKLSIDEFKALIDEIRHCSCIPRRRPLFLQKFIVLVNYNNGNQFRTRRKNC